MTLNQLKSYLKDYLQNNGVDTHKPKFQCLICGSSNGANFVPHTNHSNYPNDSGDIIEYAQQLENIDFNRTIELLSYKYNINFNNHTSQIHKPVETTSTDELEFINNEIKNILELAKTTIGNCNYLTCREISLEVQKQFNIGFCTNFIHPKTVWKHRNEPNWKGFTSSRMIIPTSDISYLARAIYKENEGKNGQYKVLKVGNTHIFNSNILKENIGYCYIFEGEIDALSAIECGYNAVGIGSTSMLNKLFKKYEINTNNVLIIAMDNDQGGQRAVPKVIELCEKYKIAYVLANSNQLFNGVKDCNQALINNKPKLQSNLEKYKIQALQFDKQAYLQTLGKKMSMKT